jgi:hypothetical protein
MTMNQGLPEHPGDGQGGLGRGLFITFQVLAFLISLAGVLGLPFVIIKRIWRDDGFSSHSVEMLIAFVVCLVAFFAFKARLGDYGAAPKISDGWWDKERRADRTRQGQEGTLAEEAASIRSIPNRKIRSIEVDPIDSIPD